MKKVKNEKINEKENKVQRKEYDYGLMTSCAFITKWQVAFGSWWVRSIWIPVEAEKK